MQTLTSDNNISKNNGMTLITSLNIVINTNMDANINQEYKKHGYRQMTPT